MKRKAFLPDSVPARPNLWPYHFTEGSDKFDKFHSRCTLITVACAIRGRG
ncbi:MAG: hypothetical protein IPO97_13235 [Sphingomonadales bacterium]|nr:hypothetical protein [Sphingomonadales bacterium]